MTTCDVSVDSTSLRSHKRLNLIIVSSCLMFTHVGMVSWVDVGGGRYNEAHISILLKLSLKHDVSELLVLLCIYREENQDN